MNDVLNYAFGGIVGLLLTASGVLAGLMRARPGRNFRELKLRLQTWWWLAGLLFLALGLGLPVGPWLVYCFVALAGLLVLTIWNRARQALRAA